MLVMVKIIARNHHFEKEVPNYVENFYNNFYEQRSPSGHKVKDMDYTLIQEDGDYYVTLFRNIWKNAEEISYVPEDKEDYNPKDLYNDVVDFVRKEFRDNSDIHIIEDGDTGDFYSVGVKVKVNKDEGKVMGEKIMSVLPYDNENHKDKS